MKVDLLGHLPTDSGRILIVDPRILMLDPVNSKEAALLLSTRIGHGVFPVYFVEDDEEGGFGKSRIVIELGPTDPRKSYPEYVDKNNHE